MRSLYKALKKRIDTINFSHLFHGFKPLPFALYNDTHVYLETRVIDKTEQFYGNTAIQFEGKTLAIWYLKDTQVDNIDTLASKIIHEMFHGYQMSQNESRFPNEIIGVRYPYNAHNLSLKHQEHVRIASLLETYNDTDFKTVCALKHYRKTHYPDAYAYESAIETTEGMAVYVELMALKQLNLQRYQVTLSHLKQILQDASNLLPIRQINYTSGALLLLMAKQQNVLFDHVIGEETHMIASLICKHRESKSVPIPKTNPAIIHLVNTYEQTVKDTIETILQTYDTHITGTFDIVGLDPMNTMFINNTLYCKQFLAYKDKNHVHYLKKASVSRVNDTMQLLEIFY